MTESKSPEESLRGSLFSTLKVSGARAHPHHEAVEAQFRHLHPCQRFAAVGRETRMHLAEMRVALRQFGINFIGGLVAGLQHFLRERSQQRSGSDQPL